jgi:hypothetical protein
VDDLSDRHSKMVSASSLSLFIGSEFGFVTGHLGPQLLFLLVEEL